MTLKKLFRYFQARLPEPCDVEPIDPALEGCRGGVGRDKKTGKLFAGLMPDLTALGRTVRVHEADHVACTAPLNGKRRPAWETILKKDCTAQKIDPKVAFMLYNGIEDARISMLPVWNKRPKSVIRDAASAALRELRGIPRLLSQSNNTAIPRNIRQEMRASAYNTALRGSALLHMANRNGVIKQTTALNALAETLRAAMPHLHHVLRRVEQGNLTMAGKHCLADNQPLPFPPMPDLPPISIQDGECDYEDECNHVGQITGPKPLDPKRQFFLVQPPLTAPCLSPGENEPQPEQASCGYRIRRGCLSQIALGLPVSRPFIRTLAPSPAGVVLVDASSSMGCDNELLRKVCRLAPGHTVLYYSGLGSDVGNIVIYAKNGMRLADSLPLPNHGGSNSCDDLALEYALKERNRLGCSDPLLFITDCGFSVCGVQETVDKEQANGSVRVIPSINQAIAEFSGLTE